jgi:hypothetical protein
MSGLTSFHVIISLIGIVTGLVVAYGFVTARRFEQTTWVFLITTLATSVTGFFFPYHGFTPGIGVGIISVLIFIPTIAARYKYSMAGIWRQVFVIGSIVLLYFNCLVLIVQSFQKVPALNALAPTGGEPAVVTSQVVLLIAAVIVGFLSVRRFRPALMGF